MSHDKSHSPLSKREKAQTNLQVFHPATKAKNSSFCLAVILITASGINFAQTNQAEQAAENSTPSIQSPRNVFAENIKPKVKRKAPVQQIYNPIQKQDDQAQIPEIEMFVGESRVFPTPGVARIAVGNGTIMSASALDNKEVLIFANGVGTSSLFVWNEDGRYQRVKINIVPGDTSRFAREIAAFLTTIPNTKASIIGDKVIVEGENLADLDIAKIDELARRYPQIVNFTNRLGWEQMVLIDVKVVEFPVSELKDIGIKWNALGGAVVGGIWSPIRVGSSGPFQIDIQTGATNPVPITGIGGGAAVLPAGLNILSAINLGLNAQLNLLAQSGRATLLAEPQLSARNGSLATFLAGGEFPYTVSTINGTTVQFKPYGVRLDVTPRVDRTGVIRAKIFSEVSTIDGSISTASGPALLTRKTETEFNVRSGETIVLSGLLSRETSKNIDKVPFLGDLPILGALFRSTRFQNKETELVVFVTPTVVDSRSPGLVDKIERTTDRLEQTLGKKPFLTDPIQPEHDPAEVNKTPPVRTPEKAAAPISKTIAEPTKVVAVTQPTPTKTTDSVPLTPASQNPLRPPLVFATTNSASGILQVKLEGLAVRAEPTLKSQVLMRLGLGATVQIGPQDGVFPELKNWRNVEIGAVNGWAVDRGLNPYDPASLSPSAVTRQDQQGSGMAIANSDLQPALVVSAVGDSAGGKRYRVRLNRLALRVAPDINALVLHQLPIGALVEALPQAPNANWIAVQAEGKRGWVPMQWLVAE